MKAIPILRIFDYNKAKEFYIDWLGFSLRGEHSFGDNFPLYITITYKDLEIHLTEHYGDTTPGTRILITDFPDLRAYHQLLSGKDYRYNKPGLEQAFWDEDTYEMEVTDPFGNRITFTGSK